MKKFSATGFTVASVLGIALLGGAAGGAMVMGGGDAAPVAPRTVGMGTVSDEAPADPAPSPAAEPAPTPAPVAGPGEVSGPTIDGSESASAAADRAEAAAKDSEAAADRSEQAADRAEKGSTVTDPAPPPTPAPVATPEPDPTPTPIPLPGINTKAGDACAPQYEGNTLKAGNGPTLRCEGGVWRDVTPAPTPTPGPGSGG